MSVHLSLFQGVANKNRRCALCRRDIPIECLEHPQLVRGTKDLNNSNSNDFRWFYEGRNGESGEVTVLIRSKK